MPSLALSGSTGGFSWGITGLGSAFNSTNYRQVGISTSSVPSSGASSVSNVVDSRSAPSSGTSTSTGYQWKDYSAGTYTFYGWAQDKANGTYWPAGSGTVTVSPAAPTTSFSFPATTTNSITVRVVVDSNYPYHKIYWRKSSSSSASTYPSSGYVSKTSTFTYTITGLDPDTSYTINVECATSSSGANATQLTAKSTSTDALPTPTATMSVSNYTHDSITVTITSDSNYPYYRVTCADPNGTTKTSAYATSTSRTFTGLTANTLYTLKLTCATNSSGANSQARTQLSQRTRSLPTTSFTLSPSDTSITVNISRDTSYNYHRIAWRKTSESTASWYPSQTSYAQGLNSYTITGLDWNTNYTVNLFVSYSSSGDPYEIGAKTTTTTQPSPTVTYTAVPDVNSITVNITADSNYPYYQIAYRVSGAASSTTQYIPSSSSVTYHSGAVSVPINNLQQGTSYIINVKYANNSSQTYSGWLGETTVTTGVPLSKWSWSASNGNATATQTSNAYTAVTSNGYTTSFSYLVWNDMCDKVKEVLDVFGYPWSPNFLNLANTKMSSSDKEMTADRWNSLRYNVGSHYTTGISEVDVGDIIYGSLFTTLMTSVNNWIDRGY